MYRETESFLKKSHAAFSDTYSLNSYDYYLAIHHSIKTTLSSNTLSKPKYNVIKAKV